MDAFELPQEHLMELDILGVRRISLICTDSDLRQLVLGFLRNEGMARSLQDVRDLCIAPDHGSAQVELHPAALRAYLDRAQNAPDLRPSGLGGNQITFDPAIPYCDAQDSYSLQDLRAYAEEMDRHTHLHKRTGGVHCSALFSRGELVSVFEDLGRHNTLDKIAGDLLEKGIDPAPCVLVTTGRISSDMTRKAARLGASVICSYSIATQRAYDAALDANLTLVGYVGRKSMRVLCGAQRVLG